MALTYELVLYDIEAFYGELVSSTIDVCYRFFYVIFQIKDKYASIYLYDQSQYIFQR